MSVTEQGSRRVPMSWDDYLALPDGQFAEWVDGVAVMTPRPSLEHGRAVVRMSSLLTAALPRLDVIAESGLWLPGNRLRGPDVMVLLTAPSTTWAEDVPILVVEVLSPSTRIEDTVVKSQEYLRAGVEQLWVVDPRDRSVAVLESVDAAWELVVRLDDSDPVGEVAVGEHGVVPLDLGAILPR